MKNLKKNIIKLKIKFQKKFLKIYLQRDPNLPFERQNVRKVLVYAYTGLGNFVLYTPALKAIKNYLHQADFILLHGNDTRCHEVVEGGDLFDNFIVIKRNANWLKRLKLIYKIRKEKYDLIISEFHNNHIFLVFLTVFSKARYRVGHASSPGWSDEWEFIYNIPVKMKKDQHEIDRYLELAYALGIPENKIDKKTFICINTEDEIFAKKFLTSHGINKEHNIVSMQVGTSVTMGWKQWDLYKYKVLCDKILKIPETSLILHGSPNEVKMIKNIVSQMKNKPIIAAGKTSIKQVAAIIKKSDILICNDSGLMHIAVAVDTPVIAIYGPTDYTRTAPLGKEHTIIRRDIKCSPCFKLDGAEKVKNCPFNYKCLKNISVDDVFKVVNEKLDELKTTYNKR